MRLSKTKLSEVNLSKVKRRQVKNGNAAYCNVKKKLRRKAKMERSDLSRRMKQYEAVPKTVLMRRTPVILRIDGRAFHTLTRGFHKPFDKVLNLSMIDTMR